MKANSPFRKLVALTAASAMLALLGSCAAPRVAPVPTPAPAPAPRPSPLPQATVPPPAKWQDMPATPGNWRWSMEAGQSVARFGDGLLTLRCDPASRTVTLLRSGTGAGQVPMTVVTSSTARALTAEARTDGLAVLLPATDKLLDAMAFSRGRFAVETLGLPTLYVPSWPEVSRVVEDCR